MDALKTHAAQQSASAFMMVRPTTFGFDDQTAQTNAFQHRSKLDPNILRDRAEAEFNAFLHTLREHHIEVAVFTDQPLPPKPNAVFPNNWLSTWPDGRVYLYPMATPSRRYERNPVALTMLSQTYTVGAVHDLTAAESEGAYLESTGAMIFDHPNRTVYACLSPRCDEQLFREHAAELEYEPITFHGILEGVPVYHTNVMLTIHSTTAILCSAAIPDTAERHQVLQRLKASGHEIIDITPEQVKHFCGNTLEVRNRHGHRFLVLSATAHAAFTPAQLKVLGQDKTLLPMEIPTIEELGGGSARCMLAEIFLPHHRPMS